MKTFERQLLVRSELVNAPYEGHCILSVLAAELTSKQQGSTSLIGKVTAASLISKVTAANPCVGFSLLNFPINEKNRLFSFGTYLIENQSCHSLLKTILLGSRGQILSEEGVDLIETLSFPSICEQIYKKVNEVE